MTNRTTGKPKAAKRALRQPEKTTREILHPIARFRYRNNLSQTSLAYDVGVKGPTFNHYEKRRRPLPIWVAARIILVAESYGEDLGLDDLYAAELVEEWSDDWAIDYKVAC